MRVVIRQGFYCMNGLNTCAQHHSKRGNTKIKTTARIYGYHPEGYESECNGEEWIRRSAKEQCNRLPVELKHTLQRPQLHKTVVGD